MEKETFSFRHCPSIANAVQCHSLLSGHYDCNVLRFSIVRNVKYHQWLKGLKSLNVFVIVFVFVVVFLLVTSCFLITLIKCFKGQKSQRSLFGGSLNVFVIVFVFAFLFFSSCFLITHISFAAIYQTLPQVSKSSIFSQYRSKSMVQK